MQRMCITSTSGKDIPANSIQKVSENSVQRKRQDREVSVDRVRNVKNSQLYRELSRYQEEGIQLWLNGRPSTSYHIADCICEKTNYMRDYHTDSQNQICGIGFDRIRKDITQTANSPGTKTLNKSEKFLKKSKFVTSRDKDMI